MVAFALCLQACAPADGTDASGDADAAESQSEGFWWWNRNYTKTKYPIVLAHGFLGFDELLGGIVQYWNGIPAAIERDGGQVFVVTSSVANSSEVRGELIISQLEELRAITGKNKFNLIGHSQGGLDVRYIAAVRPDLVASATAVAGPHKGSELAELAENGLISEIGEFAVGILVDLLRAFGAAQGPVDLDAALETLSPSGVAAFNAAYPQALPSGCGEGSPSVNGVRYYSWSGTGVLTNVFDPFDAGLGITSLFFSEANDGLVGRCSSHLGDVIRDNYFQNHLDEVNQMFGLVSPFTTNPKTVFRSHANRLKNRGL